MAQQVRLLDWDARDVTGSISDSSTQPLGDFAMSHNLSVSLFARKFSGLGYAEGQTPVVDCSEAGPSLTIKQGHEEVPNYIWQKLHRLFLLVEFIQVVDSVDHAHGVIDQQGIIVLPQVHGTQSCLTTK